MENRYLHLQTQLGEEKVAQLQEKTVTVVGLGGIGSNLAELMVRTGINVRLVEKDRVLPEDMDRLSLFSEKDVTKFKATQAKKHLAKLNEEVKVKSFNEEVLEESLFLLESDLILDCTNNEELTPLISAYCEKNKIPCVYGGVRDGKCLVAVSTTSPIQKQLDGLKIEKSEGLLPAYTHLVAGFMYMKAVKLLLGEKPKRGMLVYDAWNQCFADKSGKKK